MELGTQQDVNLGKEENFRSLSEESQGFVTLPLH